MSNGRYSNIVGRSEDYNRTLLTDLIYDDDELTPICCIKCGARMVAGIGKDGNSCATCLRPRSLTPTQEVISRARNEKTSKQLFLYQDGAKEIAEKLEKFSNNRNAVELAKRARKLEAEFATWQFVHPAQARKSSLVRELISISSDAFKLFKNNK